MSKTPTKSAEENFLQVYSMIADAKANAWQQVNSTLISLYWDIGNFIHSKVKSNGWGKGVVQKLSDYIKERDSSTKGFSARNIWRMKQFYETYADQPKLSAMLTEISWTNHLHILSKTKSIEEKEFYLQLAAKNRYPEREFSRIIDSGTFERTLLADKKLSATLTDFPDEMKGIFKESYVFDFLGLSEQHKEQDLRRGLVGHLRKFLLELGPDFSLVGEEYTLQVGMKDYRIDLLMHHRGLNCLAAIELKVTEFQPEYLGKLQFYLEVLDKEVKKSHENPSIGILICKTKDEEVVKYALNRNMSPTMISEYETKLMDKQLLQKKLAELSHSLQAA